MAEFFSELLDDFTVPVFLQGVREKYHYGETQAEEFQAVAEEMLPILQKEAFWERKIFIPEGGKQTELADAVFEKVVMSLGSGIDFLQEKYGEAGNLSQSYMIEVLAGELLMRGYDAYNRYVRGKTDRHVARYHFPGSEEAFPLEMLPDLLQELTGRITCNSAFCLLPKKSVAFIAELTQDEMIHCRGVCVGCGRSECPNRIVEDEPVRARMANMTDMPLTYGYSRIFGKF